MLRRKLIRNPFIGRSLLLLFPAAALSFNVCYSFSGTPASWYHVPVTLVHDSTGKTAPDSSASSQAAATIGLNKHVTGFVKNYLVREEEYLRKMKGKSNRYFESMETVFQQNNLPPQLKYLAVVESGLDTKARSAAGARGLWQLMPVTAKELGLKIGGKTDERVYTHRSTVAAAKYLKDLYGLFGDWLLVLAAYNSGPGPVLTAIKKSGSKNFWVLQRFLPAESRGHVKRFIGVHYFFEGQGSVTTQTKAEARSWQNRPCAGELASR
jgi:membrane-bound lytic murein transglycosylase D